MVQGSAHGLEVVSLVVADGSFLVGGVVVLSTLKNYMVYSYLVQGDYSMHSSLIGYMEATVSHQIEDMKIKCRNDWV